MVQKFLDYIAIEKKYSEKTVAAYRDDIRDFCHFVGSEPEDFDPKKVCEADIREWMLHMAEENKNSPRSIKRRLAAMRSFYKFLLRVGLIDKDITWRIMAPKVDKPLPVFFKESEMKRAIELDEGASDFESVRAALIIQLLYQTGMREAEIVALKDEDVDTCQKQVRIFGKRKKERIVPIGDKLCAQIERFRAMRAVQQKASLPSFLGLKIEQVYQIVTRRMGQVSTLKKHSPHVLRHTFATTMLNNGADIRTIQTLLGHASLAATQIYTHTTFEQIQAAYRAAHPRAGKNKEE